MKTNYIYFNKLSKSKERATEFLGEFRISKKLFRNFEIVHLG